MSRAQTPAAALAAPGAGRGRVVTQLLVSAEELLEGGESYAEITVERLITTAGISRSTFYVYFEDKGALLLALAEDVVTRLVAAAEAWWSLPHDLDRELLDRTLTDIARTYRAHHLVWGALIDGAAYDSKVRDAFRAVVTGAAHGLEQHIREGQAAGSVQAGLDPARTALWLTWMTERGFGQLLSDATDAEFTRLCHAQSAIVWATLYAGAASER